jgi:hypothetical protein
MKRKTTNSPYPVLYPLGEEYLSEQGYKDASFDVAGDPEVTVDSVTHNIWIKFDFVLDEGTLKSLVESGDALFYVNVECGLTYYRKPIIQADEHFELEIPYSEVSGSLEIFVGVIAAKDIKSFHAAGFADRFGNVTFDIDKGDILAAGTGWSVELEELDGEATPYIYVARDESEDDHNALWVDWSNDVLTIYLQKELYDIYYNRAKGEKFKSILMALVMKPAILSALQKEIWNARVANGDTVDETAEEDGVDTQGKRWLRKLNVLLQRVMEREGYTWDIDAVSLDDDREPNTLSFAVERLLNEPLKNAMKAISEKL